MVVDWSAILSGFLPCCVKKTQKWHQAIGWCAASLSGVFIIHFFGLQNNNLQSKNTVLILKTCFNNVLYLCYVFQALINSLVCLIMSTEFGLSICKHWRDEGCDVSTDLLLSSCVGCHSVHLLVTVHDSTWNSWMQDCAPLIHICMFFSCNIEELNTGCYVMGFFWGSGFILAVIWSNFY